MFWVRIPILDQTSSFTAQSILYHQAVALLHILNDTMLILLLSLVNVVSLHFVNVFHHCVSG